MMAGADLPSPSVAHVAQGVKGPAKRGSRVPATGRRGRDPPHRLRRRACRALRVADPFEGMDLPGKAKRERRVTTRGDEFA